MSHHDLLIVMGKAIGTFGYMGLEQFLGGTPYRSVLGLIWALVKAAGRAILGSLIRRIFNRGVEPPQTKEKNS